jgi:hypothetical protein
MVYTLVVEIIAEYIFYIYTAAVFVYSNNQARLMASRARRMAAAASVGQDRKQMIKQPITSHKILYGQALISGPITFMHVTNNNKYLHILITLTAHEVSAIYDIYLNDEIIKLDEGGRVLGKYADALVIKKVLGNSADDADLFAYMMAQCPTKWTSFHRQTGCAKLYARLKFNIDLFPMGLPNFAAVVAGKKVFDPRTNVTAYSNNTALCVRDYLISSQYGLGGGEYVHNGTAQAATANTLTLTTIASAVDNAYQYMTVRITGGTGIYQQRNILSYVGDTKVATVDRDWDVAPVATSDYSITDPTEEVNDTTLITSADSCDEMVILANQSNTFTVGYALSDPAHNPITENGAVGSSNVAGSLFGIYTYKFTFTNITGETKPSPASGHFGAGISDGESGNSTTGIALKDIPIGTASCTSRKIYRSEGAGYYLAGTITDNVTTTFNDSGSGWAAPPQHYRRDRFRGAQQHLTLCPDWRWRTAVNYWCAANSTVPGYNVLSYLHRHASQQVGNNQSKCNRRYRH